MKKLVSEIIIHPDELSKKWIEKVVNANVDILGIHPTGGKTASESLENLLELLKTNQFKALIDYAVMNNIKIEYELHAASFLMPRKLFDEKPEFFRMNKDGVRTNDWNFCVSNQEALSLFAKNAKELVLKLYKSSNFYYFWMDDGRDTYCHCEKCKKYSPSDQQMIAINAMLEEIKKEVPTAKMAYLAYIDSIVTPKLVKANKDVFLEYAPFEKYTNKDENAKELIDQEEQMIEPLLDLFGRENAKVLEYWYDNSLFSNWKKPPKKFILNEKGMTEDIKRYIEKGFSNIATFGCFLGNDYEELYGEVDITPFTKVIKK